jgi:AraC family transcriptional regulator
MTSSGVSLSVSGCGVAVYPPGATLGPRRLPDFEFVWLLQGAAEWRHQQGSIELTTDSLLLGRPGMVDSFVWDRATPTRHAYLHFRLDGRLPRLPDPDLWPLVRTLPGDDPLRPLLRYLLDLGEDRARDQRLTVEEVLRLLLTLFVLGPLPDRGGRAPARPEPNEPLARAGLLPFGDRIWRAT